MFEGDTGVLLVDGNGSEQIFLAPQEFGQPYTPVALDYSELRQKTDGTFTRRMLDGTVYEFDADNKLSRSVDRHGNTTVFEHSDGKLVSVTDPVGLVTSFGYSGDRVATITDPAGRVTRFTYSGDTLTSITDPDETVRKFEYDAIVYEPDPRGRPLTGLMTAQVTKRGNAGDPLVDPFRETYAYSPQGRVIGGERIDGKTFTLTPAQTFAVVDVREASLFRTAPELELLAEEAPVDVANRPEAIKCGIEHESSGTELQYVAKADYTDFRGNEIKYEMTGFGQLTKISDEIGVVRRFSRTAEGGQMLAEIDPVGNVTCFVYDPFGNMIEQTDFPVGPNSSGRCDDALRVRSGQEQPSARCHRGNRWQLVRSPYHAHAQ